MYIHFIHGGRGGFGEAAGHAVLHHPAGAGVARLRFVSAAGSECSRPRGKMLTQVPDPFDRPDILWGSWQLAGCYFDRSLSKPGVTHS